MEAAAREAKPPGQREAAVEPERLEVVEDQRIAVDVDSVVDGVQPVGTTVPRREAHTGLVQDSDAGETDRPLVEVLLIAELPVLDSLEAPFEATVAPPVENRARFASALERY